MTKVTASHFQNFVAKASETCPIFTFNFHRKRPLQSALRCPYEYSGARHLSPQGTHWGTWKGTRKPGTIKDGWRALGIEDLRPRELYEGNIEGGLLYW
jgi:hypothetical protein